MRFANLAMWTPGLLLEALGFFALLSLFLFGIALIFVGGFYLVRVARGYISVKGVGARQERSAGATQARNLALMTLVCGPIVAILLDLVTLPMVIWLPGFRFLDFLGSLALMIGMGTLAGLIGGGAFLTSSSVLGRIRKAVKPWKRGGIWDPDLDGLG
jgi:hypothetical protein